MEFDLAPTVVRSPAEDRELPILRAWERRRLTYNIVLTSVVVAVVLLAHRDLLFDRPFGRFLLARAFLANLCFCTGPVVDGYLHRVGLDGEASGQILFGLGLLVSVPATVLSVLLYDFRLMH